MLPKNWIISLIIVSTMILCSISVFVPKKTGGTAGTIFYVGGSGPGNYTTIQSAIYATSDWDTVFVYRGTYYENLLIDRTINLFGEDRNSTIIDGGNTSKAVIITSHQVHLSGFTITARGDYSMGIYLDPSSNNNTIIGNIITYNTQDGIALSSSSNTITGNTITHNTRDGICLFSSCNNNVILGNTITNNRDGIWLYSSNNNNTIIGNTITNNTRIGIWLSDSNNNNTIMENTIVNNKEYGIYFHYPPSQNKIYHNNFINNTNQATDYGINSWDNGYPSGGNYWDNYTGVDTNGDNIGDTPFLILGGNNSDRYPLMMPYKLPPDESDGGDGGIPGFELTFIILSIVGLLVVIKRKGCHGQM